MRLAPNAPLKALGMAQAPGPAGASPGGLLGRGQRKPVSRPHRAVSPEAFCKPTDAAWARKLPGPS